MSFERSGLRADAGLDAVVVARTDLLPMHVIADLECDERLSPASRAGPASDNGAVVSSPLLRAAAASCAAARSRSGDSCAGRNRLYIGPGTAPVRPRICGVSFDLPLLHVIADLCRGSALSPVSRAGGASDIRGASATLQIRAAAASGPKYLQRRWGSRPAHASATESAERCGIRNIEAPTLRKLDPRTARGLRFMHGDAEYRSVRRPAPGPRRPR